MNVVRTAVPTLARHGDIDLVTRARHGDQQAWDALVERYAPLVWSICRRYRLSRTDIDDVGQTVWLLVVARLDTVRDPAALGGWIATTTRRECGKVRRAARPSQTARWELDVGNIPDVEAESAESQLLAAERRAALRQAFTSLSPGGQQLLAMLLEDPPVPYAQISARLGIPTGSIGPTRRRCLDKLRRHPTIAALIDPEPGSTGSRQPGHTACAMAAR
jgi:RNA polymerase sigma factor (sigma-70 family)